MKKIKKNKRNVLVVVMINRGAWGCFLNGIPPQLQIEVGMMKKIIACEHCGRVLIPDGLADSE